MNGPKLTRTKSSLLRSSPTFHSLPAITEDYSGISKQNLYEERDADLESGEKEEKQRRKPPRKSGSRPRAGLNVIRLNPVLALVTLSFFSLLSFFLFFCSRSKEILTSENLLFVLLFVAVVLFLASKHMALIIRLLTTIKQICEENSYRLGFYPQNRSKPVQWFIGEPGETKTERVKSLTREGVEFYSNGDFYEGEFHKGKSNGSGVYSYCVNGRYEGDWIDGKYDGYGIESWARGSRYKGQYRQGLRCGYGVYRFYTGDCYAGEWFSGQSHGLGVQTCSDGSSYVGEFKLGVKHGLGCYHFRNGDTYTGEYFGDKIHGFGIYHFSNGHSYEGAWHEDLKQGFGVYTFRNGDVKSGEWDAGFLKTPAPPLSDSVLRAVKAAKKTAERAMNLRGVEEEVRRAVSAANKAATAARVAAVKAVQNQMDGKSFDAEF